MATISKSTTPKTAYAEVDQPLLKALDRSLISSEGNVKIDVFEYLFRLLSKDVFEWLEDNYIDPMTYETYKYARTKTKWFGFIAIPTRGGIWNTSEYLPYVIARMVAETDDQALKGFVVNLIDECDFIPA